MKSVPSSDLSTRMYNGTPWCFAFLNKFYFKWICNQFPVFPGSFCSESTSFVFRLDFHGPLFVFETEIETVPVPSLICCPIVFTCSVFCPSMCLLYTPSFYLYRAFSRIHCLVKAKLCFSSSCISLTDIGILALIGRKWNLFVDCYTCCISKISLFFLLLFFCCISSSTKEGIQDLTRESLFKFKMHLILD